MENIELKIERYKNLLHYITLTKFAAATGLTARQLQYFRDSDKTSTETLVKIERAFVDIFGV